MTLTIVMTADDMVDAELAGLDQGEVVTIPSLADKADWDRYEAARRAMSGKLSRAVPAPRYNVSAPHSAPGAAVFS
jgi:short-subunit dehydrogenase